MDILQCTFASLTSLNEKTDAISQLEKGKKACLNISFSIKNRAKASGQKGWGSYLKV